MNHIADFFPISWNIHRFIFWKLHTLTAMATETLLEIVSVLMLLSTHFTPTLRTNCICKGVVFFRMFLCVSLSKSYYFSFKGCFFENRLPTKISHNCKKLYATNGDHSSYFCKTCTMHMPCWEVSELQSKKQRENSLITLIHTTPSSKNRICNWSVWQTLTRAFQPSLIYFDSFAKISYVKCHLFMYHCH